MIHGLWCSLHCILCTNQGQGQLGEGRREKLYCMHCCMVPKGTLKISTSSLAGVALRSLLRACEARDHRYSGCHCHQDPPCPAHDTPRFPPAEPCWQSIWTVLPEVHSHLAFALMGALCGPGERLLHQWTLWNARMQGKDWDVTIR